MKRVLLLLILVFAMAGTAFAQSPATVTGNLQTLSAGQIQSGSVRFQLANIGTGNPPSVIGIGLFPRLVQVFSTDSTGAFSVSIWGNDNINPANTIYLVTYLDNLGNSIGPIQYSITGASVNLNTLTAINGTTPPVLALGAGLAANNAFTGNNTMPSLNAVLWAGPGATPTIDAQIAALGSNPGTVMISSSYTGPESANLTFNAVDGATYTIYRGSNNITIHDLRASTNKAYGVNYGGTTLGSLARFAVTQSITSPATTTSAILGTNQVAGNIGASGGALAGITAEVDVEGAISGVAGNIVQALTGQWAVRSTGQTLPLVVGVEGGGGIDRNAGAGGTNITTAVGVQGDAISPNLGTGTIQDTFGVRGFQSSAGTRNNFAIVSEGNMMFKDNACIYGENGSVAALQLICFGIDNKATGGGNIYSTTNSPAAWKYIVNGGFFNWLAGPQVNLSNAFEITPSTAVNGTTFSFPAFSISAAGILGLANGTANQYLFTPAAPAASRTINISDPTVTVSLPLFGGIGAGHIQTKRTASCTTGAAAGSTCTTTVTWTTAFADANYTVTGCGISAPTAVPYILNFTKAAGSIVVTIANLTAVAASGTIECGAEHD